jgi:hypothetical protein
MVSGSRLPQLAGPCLLIHIPSTRWPRYTTQGYGGGIQSASIQGELQVIKVKVKVISGMTVSLPVCPGIRPPSEIFDQFLFHFNGNYNYTLSELLLWGTLSDEKTGL